MIRTVLLLIASSILLISCSHLQPSVSRETYACKPWPQVLEGDYGWREVGFYIAQAKDAYNDCTAKLEALKP